MKIIRENLTLEYPEIDLSITGDLVQVEYLDGTAGLQLETEEGPERLTTNLGGHGIVPAPGNVFVRDEFAKVSDALVKAGVATKVRQVTFGPFSTTAWEMALVRS